MKIEEFIQSFADQFDDTEASVLTPETNFRELEEWTSLMGLAIMAMVDDEYSVQIKADDLRGCKTIQELFDLVNSKL